jgi:hypothetical protein
VPTCIGRPSLEGLTLVATVPVQHSYGLESSALLAMLGGAAFDSGRPFFPADVAQALASVPRPRAGDHAVPPEDAAARRASRCRPSN